MGVLVTEPRTEPPKGRLKLPEPLASDLMDFRAANYQAQETEVVQEALRDHIDRRLQEPEIKRRFDAARAKRLGRNRAPFGIVAGGRESPDKG